MTELLGETSRETRVASLTVTEAVAAMAPTVAVTVEVPAPTANPSPFMSTVRTLVALEDHCRDVSTCVLPSSKLPVAVNCCWVPAAIEIVAGEIVMEVSCAGTTVMVAESVRPPTVAVIVVEPAARITARPVVSTVATVMDEDDQVTPLMRSCTDPSL